jgi:hypothetical protein
MQLLLNSVEFRKELIRLRTHAVENIQDLSNGIPENYTPVGDDPNFVVKNGTMRIVYSMELQPPGLLHHLSISKYMGNNDLEHYPSEAMVEEIMTLLGMGTLSDCIPQKIWLEEEQCAINIAKKAV